MTIGVLRTATDTATCAAADASGRREDDGRPLESNRDAAGLHIHDHRLIVNLIHSHTAAAKR